MAVNTIEGAHTCLICKGKFTWSAAISKEPNQEGQVEVVIASTFFTVDQGRKADLEIYAKCPSCHTKYKFESSCPLEMIK
ncbi:hypothetical protein [Ammoniphilus sp. CFH 90114]|uniref:hypothetical protein n=1 Tax=Ammoniphilus sp. CFH 90114 TaxID=2493665 RepID=UPI00100FABF3|nr:hypothetical protein [Ammoniphilus sp. CFH 90114]RXT15258.1 hypothetical protein EIZ39_03335 [Ammoniphilus sp. CFH 90114]